MTIVLFILKIIGAVILAVLGILLLVLVAVLFVPFRYQICVESNNDSSKKTAGKAQISVVAGVHWLLHFLGAEVSFRDGQLDAYLRILFWKKKLLNNEEAKEDEAEVKKNVEAAAKDVAEEAGKPPEDANIYSQGGFSTSASAKVAEKDSPTDASAEVAKKNSSADVNSIVQEKKVLADKDVKKVKQQNTSNEGSDNHQKDSEKAPDGIFSRIRKLWNDFSNFRKKITRMVEDERNHRAVAHLKAELIRILKAIRPRKLSIDLEFSLGSPDLTGEVLGVCALFPIFYQSENRLIPNFEADEAYAKGFVDAKGCIYLFQILFAGLRILFDKDCKRMYRMYKKYFG